MAQPEPPARSGRRSWFRRAAGNLFLLGALAAFGIGIQAPVLTLTKLMLIHHTYSVLSGIFEFYLAGNYPLFALLALFTLALPTVKLVLLFYSWNRPRMAHGRILRWMDMLGKWSMLDVFVVAILVTSVKLGSLATTELHYGLYVFAASVVMMMLASQVVYHEVRRAERDTRS